MKRVLVLAGVLLLSAISFGQKKEIKKADKAVKSGDLAEAMSYINQAESLLGNADNDLKSQFYLVKGKALLASAGSDVEKIKLASEAFKMAKEVDTEGENTKAINEQAQALKNSLESGASSDYKAKNYKAAANKFYTAYNLSSIDTLFLFNAALASKIGKDFDNAEIYFKKLSDLGYTGIQKQFVAINKETGKEEPFVGQLNRDLMVKAGTHVKPMEKMSESKLEVVLLSLAQIYMAKDKNEEALEVINQVRKYNPKDMTLIQVEADMVYKQGNIERYNELMQEMIALDPSNPDLYNNLGVANAKLGLKDEAIKYYNKAIELNPENPGALINIAVLILAEEKDYNEKMNALGTSKADYARYDELKEEKNGLYRSAIPYLESALKYRKDDLDIVRTLKGIYGQLGEDAKVKEMKMLLETLEGGQ
ncbi:MAG: tetratricopeptide (TPR) repeat protein [Ulvibacter sp.]|jgi:tetratricopeptide (TPR) repeat protein